MSNNSKKTTGISVDDLKRQAAGQWPQILLAAGLSYEQTQPGHKGPCPICRTGTDRYAPFSDVAETGGVMCRHCHNAESLPKSGDGFAAVQWLQNCSFPEALQFVAAELQHNVARTAEAASANVVQVRQSKKHATVEAAAKSLAWSLTQHGQLSREREPDAIWSYLDEHHEAVGAVLRWDIADGNKEIRPVRREPGGWVCGAMKEPRPLFGLPSLASADPDTPVFVCEGEKSAAAGQSLGLVCITSMGGSNAAAKSNWNPVRGRSVVIIPDHDEPGQKYAKVVAQLCRTAGATSVKLLHLPDIWPDCPASGDLDDYCEAHDSKDTADLRSALVDAPMAETATTASSGGSGDSGGSDLSTESHCNDPDFRRTVTAAEIEVELDELRVNKQVIQALAQRGDVYVFGGGLVTVAADPEHNGRRFVRRLVAPTVRELISESVRFFSFKEDPRNGETRRLDHRVPRWCSEAIAKRGEWQNFPVLRGIVRCPTITASGRILQTEGYDPDSGLWLDLGGDSFPTIAETPSLHEAVISVAILRDLVSDFPFRRDSDFTGWLAAILTVLARECHAGATGPLFLIDANVRGAGKSLLADLVAIITTGTAASRLVAPATDEEFRKRIGSLVDSGERLVLIDNINGAFGGAAIDAALTGTTWKDRRLGCSEMIFADLRICWLASGNNTAMRADTARRTCHIRLDSPEENPEDRSGFRFPDIRQHAQRNRAQYLTAALTILRGYLAAGKPDQQLPPWGSFEEWSAIVRNALTWAGLPDCRENCEELRQTADTEASALGLMLDAITTLDQTGSGLKVAELLKIASGAAESFNQSDANVASEAIETLCESYGKTVSSRRLGNRLAHYRNRIINGRSLDFRTVGGNRFWYVRQVATPATNKCDVGAKVESPEPPESPQGEVNWVTDFEQLM